MGRELEAGGFTSLSTAGQRRRRGDVPGATPVPPLADVKLSAYRVVFGGLLLGPDPLGRHCIQTRPTRALQAVLNGNSVVVPAGPAIRSSSEKRSAIADTVTQVPRGRASGSQLARAREISYPSAVPRTK